MVTINDIARAIGAELTDDENTVVRDVTHDSRQVSEGWLFVAVRGANVDAHRFVSQVMKQGAAGVISELPRPGNFSGAWLQVEDARRAMALAAAEAPVHTWSSPAARRCCCWRSATG